VRIAVSYYVHFSFLVCLSCALLGNSLIFFTHTVSGKILAGDELLTVGGIEITVDSHNLAQVTKVSLCIAALQLGFPGHVFIVIALDQAHTLLDSTHGCKRLQTSWSPDS
jgi:hypothetical protein